MRIIVLVAGAGDERVGIGERRDHREIGVAELALVVDDPLALEARRVLGEEAGLIDGEGDFGIDACARAARCSFAVQISKSSHAVAGRRMHKSRAGILGDMLAGEQRHIETDKRSRCEEDAQPS